MPAAHPGSPTPPPPPPPSRPLLSPLPPLPPLSEVLALASVVSIPTTTSFRGIRTREAVVFDAPQGASEFSPFTEYLSQEAANWLAASLEYGWSAAPPALRDSINVNATIPAIAPGKVRAMLDRFPGCTTVKVKVAEPGQSLRDDIERVREVRRQLNDSVGPEALIRVDANMAWSPDEAVTAIRALDEFQLDYAEQPCRTIEELAQVRRRIGGPAGVRIAADESVRKASDPLAVARAGAADLLVVKAQPLGGISRAIKIIEEAGLPVVISSALDTSVGISMGLRLAAALPEHLLGGASGLGTVALLRGDVTRDRLLAEAGAIRVRRPALDDELLRTYAASPDREDWWRARITACYEVLEHRLRTERSTR